MLRSVQELKGYVVSTHEGEAGRVHDILFDDRVWTVRYLVADTGKWLPGKKVLLSPASLGDADWKDRRLRVLLDKESIEKSPLLDEDAPVSRQHEQEMTTYFGWPVYWTPAGTAGPVLDPPADPGRRRPLGDGHLRSCQEVVNYKIQARDGSVGHVEDFVVDDDSWVLRYMVVDTRTWLPGKEVLVSPDWIEKIDWFERDVAIDLTVDQIKESPEFDPDAPVNREIETRLYDFYGRPKYWEKESLRR